MYVSSFAKHLQVMKKLQLTPGKKLADLGCGDGKAMRFFAKEFGVQCDGYEIQSFPFVYGKLLNKVLGYSDIGFYKKDFSQADLHRYDYIYLYLLPHQMADIEPRIFKNISSTAIIISNSFPFAAHKPYKTLQNIKGKPLIFLYRQ